MKCVSHADNVHLLVMCEQEAGKVKEELEKYGMASETQVNAEKSKIIDLTRGTEGSEIISLQEGTRASEHIFTEDLHQDVKIWGI